MSELQAGQILTLPVKRVIDTGYVLGDTEEVLLHQNEAKATLTTNDEVEVYLYHDKKQQLIATTTLPHVRFDIFDWAEVTEIKEGLGVFVDTGTSRHVLVSSDDLPELRSIWPEVGDVLYVTLKLDKRGRLLADPVREEDFEGNWDIAPESLFNQDIKGRVFRSGREGAVVITEEGYRGFIHNSERKRDPRIGEWIEGRIIKVKEDGSLNISLLPRKQDAQATDAATLLAYLEAHDDEMSFDNKSEPELIQTTFNMSKAAFKRAIGLLLKERLIKQSDGKTYLIKE
ncbi:hypothetical protein DES38_104269 [Streptohalobacillus salinus]|uniref:S1 motif domain-containing protein n=1 Tax=Streptohalobacillus salinus TaxID=621096 RepID=A0A2V3WBJ5_9BACI|nr:S1-like domain-containing RNA-binding protein [Streptohalobacillus salinus]PXW91833.1 hypothetical protein DES38_104269 [Streptohalobacillus salinus]